MKMDDWMKKEIQEEMEQIKAPESLYTFAHNIKEESMKMENQQKQDQHTVTPFVKKKKRRFQFAAAAVVGLGVMTGSAYINPTMAEMASKIPYLGQVFQQKPIIEVIYAKFEKEGYKELGIGVTPGDVPHYDIRFKGTEEDANRERKKITGIVEDILKSRGKDNYKITVSAYTPEILPLTDDEKKMTEFGEKIGGELKAKGYDIIVVNPFNSEIEVTIPTTEERQDEIKELVLSSAKENGINKKVKFDIMDRDLNAREGQWMTYLGTIDEGLSGKKDYYFKSYGYSYRKGHVKIWIYTTLDQNSPLARETVINIKKEVDSFLSSNEVKSSVVKNDTYELHITDKKKKDFNF